MKAVPLATTPHPRSAPSPVSASITCAHTVLVDALTTAGLALDPRHGAPESGGVLLAAVNGGLLVSGSNWDTSISVRIPDAEARGALLIDHAELAKLLAALAKGRKKAEITGLRVEIAATDPVAPALAIAGHRVPLTAYPLDDLPPVHAELPLVARLDRALFTAETARVLKAASTDETLPAFCGVKIDVGHGAVTLAGTDRFRLAIARIPAVTVTTESTDGGAVVPARLLAKLLKRFPDERLRIGWERDDSSTSMSLSCGPVTVVTRSTTDSFVEYAHVVPTTATCRVVANRNFLVAATKQAAAIAMAKGEGHPQIDLRIDPLEISVLPVLYERGGEVAAPGISADVDGVNEEDLLVRFNATFFLDTLNTFGADQVTLHLNGPTRPVVMTDTPTGLTEAAAFRHLLMPIRAQAA